MFYKLLDNKDNLITVSTKPAFYKYSKTNNRLISVKRDIADIVIIDGRQYKLQGNQSPEDTTYTIISISEEEYNELSGKIEDKPPVISLYLKRVREEKINELCSICQQKITEGCNITLSNGIEHFRFTNEDQMNITRIMNNIQIFNLGKVLYHSSGNKVEYYSTTDFSKIYDAMNKHITYHTTYFNLLKNCINNMYNPQDIKNIYYGYVLTDPKDKELLKQIRR